MSQLARQGSSTVGEGILVDSGAIFSWSFSAHVCQSAATRLLPPAAVRLLAELLPTAVRLQAAWLTLGSDGDRFATMLSSTTYRDFAQFALRAISSFVASLLFTGTLLKGFGARGTDEIEIDVGNGCGIGGDFGCICPTIHK